MVSFRARVLDALDIHKKTVKLQVNETFPKIYDDSNIENNTGHPIVQTIVQTTDENGEITSNRSLVDYAVSKEIIGPTNDYRKGIIGPNVGGAQPVYQTLDIVGFVVGQKPSDGGSTAQYEDQNSAQDHPYPYKNCYPVCITRNTSLTEFGGYNPAEYTGFHYLNGLYDPYCHELQSIRKSALPLLDKNTFDVAASGVTEMVHSEWPKSVADQAHLLNENPDADSLYYHAMRLSFLLTGITIPKASEKASNHRGLVRMLIVRPRFGRVNVRWGGSSGAPCINMPYPPHWDTELFYSGKKTLAGRMDKSLKSWRSTPAGASHHDDHHEEHSHMSPTFGLTHRSSVHKVMDTIGNSIHYGHPIPTEPTSGETVTEEGTNNEIATEDLRIDFNAYDMITAPINRDAYAVIADKTFTLDTMHHGVASHRLENIVIPFNKKVKFPGREAFSEADLSGNTIDEPLNMASRPIIMFLSMDQKLSVQVTGYTAITET